MINHEDQQLNYPVKRYFERRLKCAVSRSEFRFTAGKLDVLAYDRGNKCFHICEGKRSSNVASVGHAIGQLIAYMSMIQESGYNFLNTVSKEERLELTDFTSFLESRAINVCFYVALPDRNKDRLLNPAKLMLNNMGNFGSSIGLFFASKKKCELAVPAKPIQIKIRRVFEQKEFLGEINRRFFASPESAGLEECAINNRCLQIKEKDGNPYLHYEVWTKARRRGDSNRTIETAFHLEFAKDHLGHKTTFQRKEKIKRVLVRCRRQLKKSGFPFRFEPKWGKRWSRLYALCHTHQPQLDDQVLEEVLTLLKGLVSISKPMLDKINWGRLKRQKEE